MKPALQLVFTYMTWFYLIPYGDQKFVAHLIVLQENLHCLMLDSFFMLTWLLGFGPWPPLLGGKQYIHYIRSIFSVFYGIHCEV